ncbi:MAG TPA: Rieske (2Fe-2S) protein [Ktedonobacteraceae bacterium]
MTEYSSFDETKDVDQESSTNAYSAMEQQRISRRRLLSLVGTGGGAVVATTILAACSIPGVPGAPTVGTGHNTPKSSKGSTGSTSSTGSNGSSGSNGSTGSTGSSGSPPQTGGDVLAQTSAIPINSAQTFPISGQTNPGVIVHLSNDQFVAYDSTCTHQQCAVTYNPTDMLLECPCHGATFDPANNGAVVQGPAMTPLTAINITVSASGAITRS